MTVGGKFRSDKNLYESRQGEMRKRIKSEAFWSAFLSFIVSAASPRGSRAYHAAVAV
ncbi:hypothetical protein BN133_3855 [Cronobacter dublinensis 582]|nr:hypothetical protein BN133_3855 [Cronobacter dublinensis 582]